MNRFTTILSRSFATVLALALVNLSVPMGGITHFAPDPHAPKPAPVPEKSEPKVSKPLSAKQSRTLQGKFGKNPYLAGQNKWDVVYKGINLLSGNFTTSGTDLTFEGGYGIPVNVTRSYSANNIDQGPLGEGWTLSVDVRTTSGGLLKSSGSAVRSVPVSFKERPSLQDDPRIPSVNEPVEAVIATDAGGLEETIQKDVDGILTTPSWDKNRNISEYETVTVGTALYQILKHNIVTTPEGTVYVYEKKGSYDSPGMRPWNDEEANATPANVLKITSVTDRHGNVTTYNYGSTDVTFAKSNGTVTEKRLESIEMPNGHEIEFTWGNALVGTNYTPVNRIWKAADGVREVTYGYTNSMLTSVTSPAGKITTYGYGSSDDAGTVSNGNYAGNLLTSVTDPRGLTSTIHYYVGPTHSFSFDYTDVGVRAYKILNETGTGTYVFFGSTVSQLAVPTFDVYYTSGVLIRESVNGSNTPFTEMSASFFIDSGTYYVREYGRTRQSATGYSNGVPYMINRQFDVNSQNLLNESRITFKRNTSSMGYPSKDGRHFIYPSWLGQKQQISNVYNYLGNPLEKTVTEETKSVSGTTVSRVATVGFSYWGKDKYYQQKAVKDQAGRVTYTDYFDSQATQGKKGQTYRVYDDKQADFLNKTASNWRYIVEPASSSTYTSEFDYDAKGRATDVWKVQKTTTSPWTYVQTKTTYGSDGSPTWGAATQVIEDYGSGRINRTTNTLAYDTIGRAVEVQDASGRVFETNYDLDGMVQSVYRTDSSLNQMLVSYSYGSTPNTLSFGMVTQVADGLSGIVQDFTYETIGGGMGQIASITETNGLHQYSTSYTYNDCGDRDTTTSSTPNGVTSWRYTDYFTFGSPSSPRRAFATLTMLNGSGNGTSEEFHYEYDNWGNLVGSAFGQTPQTGSGAPTSAPFYTSSFPADTRARAYFTYDPGGRVTNVEHYADDWNGTAYVPTPIIGNSVTYELSGSNRGLKTSSSFYVNDSGNWSSPRTEYYSYDGDLDYLISADYNDGLANENPSWSYDAAGNRNDASVVDNLNRATTIGGVARTYDIVGNTLTVGSTKSMTWDVLNRMATHTNNGVVTMYQYRADGMRTTKQYVATEEDVTTSRYYYDGQMPIETFESRVQQTATTDSITRNIVGVRGIERIERVNSSGTTIGYPVYDIHGNMVATLAKNNGAFAVNDERSYDAWGVVRQGNTTGDPKGRFCAVLGHVDDDESDMTYMRARYYEPRTGRFISQDREWDGANWFIYGRNMPTMAVDRSGNSIDWWTGGWLAAGMLFTILAMNGVKKSIAIRLSGAVEGIRLARSIDLSPAYAAVFCYTLAMCGADVSRSVQVGFAVLSTLMGGLGFAGMIAQAEVGAQLGNFTLASNTVRACFAYSLLLIGALIAAEFD